MFNVKNSLKYSLTNFSLYQSSLRSLFIPKWSSDVHLDGKTAIVTGANVGIGKETAKDLAGRGKHTERKTKAKDK